MLMPHAKSMESVPNLFQSPFVIKPQSMMLPMPISGDVTLARLLRSEVIRLTICGWLHIVVISFGNITAISMLSPLHQSKPSNTSTNMSTRAMITLQWSLVAVRMRLRSILILNMSLPVRVFGVFSISICTRKAHQWSISKSILKVNK